MTSAERSKRVAGLAEMAKAATPGPWTTDAPPKDVDGWNLGGIVCAVARGQAVYATPPGGFFPENDRRLITVAPEMASLLQEYEAEIQDREQQYRAMGEYAAGEAAEADAARALLARAVEANKKLRETLERVKATTSSLDSRTMHSLNKIATDALAEYAASARNDDAQAGKEAGNAEG